MRRGFYGTVMQSELSLARKVTWVGFWVNAALGVLKVLAGIFGRSSAMVADGVHSFSDFVSDIIVIVFMGISRRKANDRYQYGHGKYETFATMMLGVILAMVGAGFLIDGIGQTIEAANGKVLARPDWIALAMALASIASKEWLYQYTRRAGQKINSPLIIANAWHHRSDALSSLATLAGIAGAMFLGQGWRVLDPIAAIVVSIFVLIAAYKIAFPAVLELLEVALPAEQARQMWQIIGTTPGVKAFHQFASRRNGYILLADFHIKVHPGMTVKDAHDVATDVEHRIKDQFGPHVRVNVHIEPYKGEEVDELKMCR